MENRQMIYNKRYKDKLYKQKKIFTFKVELWESKNPELIKFLKKKKEKREMRKFVITALENEMKRNNNML